MHDRSLGQRLALYQVRSCRVQLLGAMLLWLVGRTGETVREPADDAMQHEGQVLASRREEGDTMKMTPEQIAERLVAGGASADLIAAALRAYGEAQAAAQKERTIEAVTSVANSLPTDRSDAFYFGCRLAVNNAIYAVRAAAIRAEPPPPTPEGA